MKISIVKRGRKINCLLVLMFTILIFSVLSEAARKLDFVVSESIGTKREGEDAPPDYLSVEMVEPLMIDKLLTIKGAKGKYHIFQYDKNQDATYQMLDVSKDALQIEDYKISDGLISSKDGNIQIKFDKRLLSSSFEGPPKLSGITIAEIKGRKQILYGINGGAISRAILLPEKGTVEFVNYGGVVEVKVTPQSVEDYIKQDPSGAFAHLVKRGEEYMVKSFAIEYYKDKTIALVSRGFEDEITNTIPGAVASEQEIRDVLGLIETGGKGEETYIERDTEKIDTLKIRNPEEGARIRRDSVHTPILTKKEGNNDATSGSFLMVLSKNIAELSKKVDLLLKMIVEYQSSLLTPNRESKEKRDIA